MNAVAQQIDFRASRAYPVMNPNAPDDCHDTTAYDAMSSDTAEIYRPEPFYTQPAPVEPAPPLSIVTPPTETLQTAEQEVEAPMDAVAIEGVRAHNRALSLREMGRAAIAEAEAHAAANPQKDSLFTKLRSKFAKQ